MLVRCRKEYHRQEEKQDLAMISFQKVMFQMKVQTEIMQQLKAQCHLTSKINQRKKIKKKKR